MLNITWTNGGGVIDAEEAPDPAAAIEVAIAMLRAAGELHDGDNIHVQEV